MNYIILDMEWNQAVNPAKMVRSPVMLHGEIIQIGAVKTDENFNLLDKIKINIRPKYYKKMNPHVQKITGITSLQLTAGEVFPQAFRRFSAWCGEEFRFITWGFDDVGVLADNLTLHGLDPSYGSDYINLQLIYNRQVDSEHLQCALSTAAEKLEIPLDVQVHDALNDAYLTYEVCRKLDMTLGLAEYSEYAAAIPTLLFKDAVNSVRDPRKMLTDSRVTNIKCPRCGGLLTLKQWVFSNGKSCKTVGVCEKCGNVFFSVKLKAVKVSEGNFTVLRMIYAADEQDAEAHDEKIRQREARKRKLAEKKKAEGKNDQNGDD